MRTLISGVFAAVLLASVPALVLAAGGQGTAQGVTPSADAQLEGATRTLVVGADIFIGDLIETGPKGQVQILFADNTHLVVGPQSSLKIDDYLLRNNGDAGKFVVDMLSGSFRFATGNGPKAKYEINTPTGTIGVRGTGFDVFVDVTGWARILHHIGTVIFKANGEKVWQTLHDACTVGEIRGGAAKVLGNSKSMTGTMHNDLKAEFRYSDNQSPLLHPYWFANALDCLHTAPDNGQPPSLSNNTNQGPSTAAPTTPGAPPLRVVGVFLPAGPGVLR
jgi:hypothetical protein